MNPQPHQYPLYKPTTNFSSAFVPNVPVVEELISPFAEHTQAFPTRQGYSNPAIDITTMIYMSNIPPSLSTYSMEQILWACGPVRSFKRVVDYNGRNRRSGFCTFENSLALVRALRVLGGEGVADVPELKGGIKLIPGVDISCFRIAADPIARFSLRAVHDPTPAESDRITIDKIRVVLAGLTLSESDFRAPPKKQHVAKRAAPSQAPAEQLQLMTHISKEELALEEEQDRKRAEKRQQEQKAAFHDVVQFNLARTTMACTRACTTSSYQERYGIRQRTR